MMMTWRSWAETCGSSRAGLFITRPLGCPPWQAGRMALLTLLLAACAALPFPPAALAQTCSATSVAITGIDASTLGTNPVLTGLVDDCTTLLEDIKDDLRGTATLNWEETAAMDTWEGIWDDGITVSGTLPRVTNLLLSGRSLSGEIPAALGTLTQLELLDLRTNQLSGEIPATWGTSTHPLPNLTALNLAYNKLTGTIPPELGTLTQLELLDLRRNQLSGEIPATWGTSTHPLPNLTALDLANNLLTGTIPPALGALTQLELLYLRVNRLGGEIPATWGTSTHPLPNLTALDLANNLLTGTIPPELATLTQLQRLYLGVNQLTGTIPPALGALTQLDLLNLADNLLTGAIPPALGALTQLGQLNLADNQLTGTIPPELATLTQLHDLALNRNELSGPILPELGNLSALTTLDLSRNELSGPIPPQLGSLSNLRILYLSRNQLTGPIPATWGTMTHPFANLIRLYLHATDWEGTMPPQALQDLGLTRLLTNRRPTAPAVSNQVVTPGEMFEYIFPAFTDRDGDTLTYSVTQEDGSDLPDWLTFTQATDTLTFSSTSYPGQPTVVTVTATDTPQDHNISPPLSASVTFRIGPPSSRGGSDAGDSDRETTSPSVTGPTHVEYAENATQPVAAYTATNLQTPTWRVTGPDAAAFALSPSGVLRFSRPPDYEAPTDTDRDNRYTITVHAAAGTTTAQLAVTITVTDVGEHDDSTDDDDGAPCAPDRHGGSPAQATWLRLPATLAGAICPADDQDYFQVRVPRAGLVFVQTTGRTPIGVTVWQDGVKLGQIAPSNRWQHFRLGVPVRAGPVVPVLAGPVVVAVQGTGTVLYELAVTFVTGVVENPAPASFQSGIGVISGWVCDAETVEIVLNAGPPVMAAYGTSRADTSGVCGDTDNGFGLLFNWNLLGDGEHTVMTLVNGVELDRTTVTVTTLGTEFLRDVHGVCIREHFPSPGESVRLSWQEAQQNFVITDGAAPPADSPAGPRPASSLPGVLENPSPASFQSGIGVISGWVCAAEEVVIEIDEMPLDAAYGTSRADTAGVCGDTDNGFGLLFNWNMLGDGEHTAVAWVDGVELGRATVTVSTLGEEFVRGAAGRCVLADFPTPGETVSLSWQEAQQNFVLAPLP